MEMRVHITNYHQNNDTQMQSATFTLPIQIDELKDKLNLSPNDSYIITDYELPFDISQEESIDEINRLYHIANELSDFFPLEDIPALIKTYFNDIDELYDQKDTLLYIAGGNIDDALYYLYPEMFSSPNEEVFDYNMYQYYQAQMENTISHIESRSLETINGIYVHQSKIVNLPFWKRVWYNSVHNDIIYIIE